MEGTKKVDLFSWDNGFTYEKFVTDIKKGEELSFQSVSYRSKSDKKLMDKQKNYDIDNLALEFEGQRYLIGSLASQTDPQGGLRTFDKKKYNRSEEVAKFLAGVAYFHNAKEIEIDKLMLGINISDYHDLKENVKDFYEEEEFKYKLDSDEDYRTVEVNQVKVLPQGVGGFYNEILDDQGKVIPSSDLLDLRCLIIDIGGKTVDYFIKASGSAAEIVEDTENSLDYGTNDAFINASKELGIPSQLLENAYINEDYVLTYNRQQNRIKDPCDEALKNLAEEIKNSIEYNLSRQLDRVESVLLLGGGAISLKEYITNAFNIKTIISNDSQMTNARGYFKLGLFENRREASEVENEEE